MKYGAPWVVTLLICVQIVTGQVINDKGPNIIPKQITLQVVKTAAKGTNLTTLSVDNVFDPSGFGFNISLFNTNNLVRLARVPGKPFSIRLVLNTSLEAEKTPSMRSLYVTAAVKGGIPTTATVSLWIVNPVSRILTGLNSTGLIGNTPDVQTVISNLARFTQTLCNVYTNQSPSTAALSRFRLFCLMFQAVYLNLPPSIFPDEPPDLNQPPAFVSQTSFTVPENLPVGSRIGILTATDSDGPQEISFSPTNAQTAALIRLSGATGQSSRGRFVTIYLREQLDREEASINTLYITASDGQSMTTAMVSVALTDVNDNTPVFSRTEYRFTISSLAEPGTKVGNVYATDLDLGNNGRVSYSFSGLTSQTSALFSMNSFDGSIYVKQSLRSRTNQTLTVVVRARDGGRLFTSATVRIFVSDRNTSRDCRSDGCNNAGTCYRPFNSTYRCVCSPGFFGPRCEYRNTSRDCRSDGCNNAGTCYRLFNSTYRCVCSPGFFGPRCEYRNTSRDCRSDGCNNAGTCYRPFNSTYRCVCSPGFFGPRCEYRNTSRDCRSDGCNNAGTCYRPFNSTYRCVCSPGFFGPRCEYRNTSRDCRSDGCNNAGTCYRPFNSTYRCVCSPGFFGPRCEYRNTSSDCRNNGCANGGTCYQTNSVTYRCNCLQGYYGPRCENRNFTNVCLSSPCRNGGRCVSRTDGTFNCLCEPYYTGTYCEYRTSTNVCSSNPCRNDGSCVFWTDGTFSCLCQPNYTGTYCEYRNVTNLCLSNPCRNGGRCISRTDMTFNCLCFPSYYGPRCEYRNFTNACLSNPCRNGGRCVSRTDGTFNCICQPNYTGTYCEYRNNSRQCDVNVCENGGSCSRTGGGQIRCSCPAGFTGNFCEEDVRLRFRVREMAVAVRENTLGTNLGTVYVDDVSLVGGRIYITSNDSQNILRFRELFSRSSAAWSVSLQRRLDREQQSTRWFKLTVYRGNRKAEATLVINVIDINDNPPVFASSRYTSTVDNDAVQGTPVITVHASDADAGANGTVYYNITGGSSQRFMFHIDNRTGVITVDGSLLSLVNQQIQLIVTATDGGIPRNRALASVFITVRQGDGRIKFALRAPTVNVSESALRGTPLIRLPIGPVSSGRRVSVRTNDTQGILSVRLTVATNIAIASVTLNAPIDRERNETMAFKITVSDGVTTANATLVLNVTDVNDNAPSFTAVRRNITVDRRWLPGTVIGVVNASDPDSGSNGTLNFTIIGGTRGYDFFNISQRTGVLSLRRHVAFAPPWIALRIRVQDGGSPSLQSFTTVNISLVTGPNCASSPCRNGGTCSVSRNLTVICACPFGYTGPRCERGNNSRQCDVNVCENGGSCSRTGGGQIRCSCPTGFTGNFCEEDVRLRFRVREMAVAVRENTLGTNLGTVYVDDVSLVGGRIYITSNDSQNILRFRELFSRSSAAWSVSLQRRLDREQQSTRWFKLTVYRGDRTAEATLVINVIDINDNPPVFASSRYTATIDNDAVQDTPVITVHASDADAGANGTVYYNITGGSSQRFMFHIDNRTGVITVDGSLLSLANQQIQLIVTATDGGIPRNRALASVFITVRQGDGRIKFALRAPTVNVSESALRGTPLIRLPIGPVSSGRRVSVRTNDTQGILSVRLTVATNIAIASVTLNAPIDRERNETMAFNITVSDGVTTANATLVLNVTDVNDNAPSFTAVRRNITVDRRWLPGTVIGVVNASDPDSESNGTLNFTIIGGTRGYDFFNISQWTGVLSLRRHVAFAPPWIALRIRVQDGGSPSLQSFTTVNISLVLAPNCASSPCRNGGTCSVSRNLTVICACPFGYTGPRCERESSLRFRQNPLRVTVPESTIDDLIGNEILLGFLLIDDLLQPSTGRVFLTSNDTRQIIRFTRFLTSATASFRLTLRNPVDREMQSVMIFSVTATLGNRSANGTVILNITDVNDNSPVFNQTVYNASVWTDSFLPIPVITVRASDADAGLNGIVFYSIVGGSSERSRFHINNMTGETFVNSSIPDLVGRQIQLIIAARDGGLPTRQTRTVVLVNMQRGSGPLRFRVASTTVNVSEGTARGTEVFRMSLNSQAQRMTVRSNDTRGIISVRVETTANLPTVVATLNGFLDRERNETMVFNITASTGVNTASTLLILNITDVNDNAPVFNSSQSTFSVNKLAAPGTRFGRVYASDLDKGRNANVTYDIVGGSFGYDSFNMSSRTGQLFVTRYLTSLPSTVTLRIKATDGGIPRLETIQTFTIQIITGPSIAVLQFNPRNYSVSALESFGQADILTRLVLMHADQRLRGAEVSFREPSFTTYALPIVIDSDLSYISLRLNKSLRNQVSNRLTVNITAVVKDSTITANCSVTIVIQRNVEPNNFAPVFRPSTYSWSVLPDIPIGSGILMVTATDADTGVNGQIRYVMTRGRPTFAVNATTGAITINGSLTGLANTRQTLTVVATDNGRPAKNASATVFVSIGSLPDDPSAPSFLRSSYFFTVRENQPSGTLIGRLMATDASGGNTITFRFGDDGAGAFSLGQRNVSGIQSSVAIMTTRRLDRETVPMYTFTVVASDGNAEDTTTVRVQVQDVNDNSPTFSQRVYTVQAPVVSANPDLSSPFLVERSSGRVVVGGSLQALADQRVEFTIVATDNGIPPLSGNVTVQIDVIASNGTSANLRPVFIGVPENLSISENAEAGSRLFVATIRDMDGPVRSSLTLEDRVSFDTVSIGGSAGNNTHTYYVIRLNTFLNREVDERKVFRLVASDGLNSVTATVTLVIQDVNDNAPRFQNPSYNGVVSSSTGIGMFVLNVSATDPDQMANGQVRYSIQSSSLPGYFEVDPLTGQIRVSSSLSSLARQTVSLRIEARDMGVPALNASVLVVIAIQSGSVPVDNNNPPQITPNSLTVQVAENAPRGVVSTVQVADADGPQAVTLRVAGDTDASGSPLLSVLRSGSQGSTSIYFISTNVVFDREAGATRNVLLIAGDGSGAESTATVLIQVQDKNDNLPIFTQPSYTASVSSTAPVNTSVIQTQAKDADSGLFGEVTYTMTTTLAIDEQQFSIDPRTGAIRIKQSLAGRSGQTILIVKATDGGRRSTSVNVIVNIL